MDKVLGQSKNEWIKQLSNIQRIKNLDPQTRDIVIKFHLDPLGIDTTKDRTIHEARLRIWEIISRLKHTEPLDEVKKAFIEYYGNSDIIDPNDSFSNETDSKVSEKTIKKINQLFNSGFLRRLKSRKKDGIVDANLLETMDTESIFNENDLIKFAINMSVEEWENLYEQSTKIAKMEGLNVVPVFDIDKHFCKIFDMKKVKKVLPSINNSGLFDAWYETIGYSSAIMKNLLRSNRRKKQLDFLALTIFYSSLNKCSDELVMESLYDEIKKFCDISKLKSNQHILQQFTNHFNEKYREFFVINKKEYIQLYNIPEKTFYRRQREDYLPYRKSLLEDVEGKKYMDFATYYKMVYKIKSFSVSEKVEK